MSSITRSVAKFFLRMTTPLPNVGNMSNEELLNLIKTNPPGSATTKITVNEIIRRYRADRIIINSPDASLVLHGSSILRTRNAKIIESFRKNTKEPINDAFGRFLQVYSVWSQFPEEPTPNLEDETDLEL